MKIRGVGVLLGVVAAASIFLGALGALAQAAPDGTVVQGGVVQGGIAQGPSRGDGGGQFPFGRGAGVPLPPNLGAGAHQTLPPTATPTPADASASNDVLHPSQQFATAQCQDGWFSYSQVRDGTCAGHGGVMLWIVQPGDLDGLSYQRAQEASATAADIQAAFIAPSVAVSSATPTGTPPPAAGISPYAP